MREAKLEVVVYRLSAPREVWPLFAPHHYLRQDLSSGCKAWIGVIDDDPVVFSSAITMPSGTLKNAWREHRTVVLPDYQGFGIGYRMVESVAEKFLADGYRFYSRTTHPRIGEKRMRDTKWRATKKNQVQRKAHWKQGSRTPHPDTLRIAYSHEYIGGSSAFTA